MKSFASKCFIDFRRIAGRRCGPLSLVEGCMFSQKCVIPKNSHTAQNRKGEGEWVEVTWSNAKIRLRIFRVRIFRLRIFRVKIFRVRREYWQKSGRCPLLGVPLLLLSASRRWCQPLRWPWSRIPILDNQSSVIRIHDGACCNANDDGVSIADVVNCQDELSHNRWLLLTILMSVKVLTATEMMPIVKNWP